jgi:aryl sulfotransferase
MEGQIRRIANFLGIEMAAERWPTIFDHCSFDWMKANAVKAAPLGGVFWDGGAQTFIHKGTNGRWREVLTAEESRKYERLALENLGPDCARWLAKGTLAQGLAAAA